MPVDWGQVAQVGMNLASQYANSRQQARAGAAQAQQTQNSQGIAQNSAQNNVLLQMAQIELLRKELEQRSRPQNAQQVGLGDMLASTQDAAFSRPSHITNMSLSGGLRPSAMGPNTREAGRTLSTQALGALQGGQSFMPLNPAGPIDLSANMPQESLFDKLMAGAGAVGGAMGAYDQAQKQTQQEAFMQELLKQMQQEQQRRSFKDAVDTYAPIGLGL